MKKTTPLLLLLLPLVLGSCHTQSSFKAEKETLRQADLDFAGYSADHGMNAAFLKFADSTVVLLRPHHSPVKGITSMVLLLNRKDDSAFTLNWEPESVEVAASGDLGYTYGIYTISDGKSKEKGTYVTVWKRNTKGEWKFVLDSGNAGLGDED